MWIGRTRSAEPAELTPLRRDVDDLLPLGDEVLERHVEVGEGGAGRRTRP